MPRRLYCVATPETRGETVHEITFDPDSGRYVVYRHGRPVASFRTPDGAARYVRRWGDVHEEG